MNDHATPHKDVLLYWYEAKLIRIIDADTIVIDIDLGCNQWIHTEHVRLLGIDAPEVRGSDKEAGKESRDFLASLLPQPGSDTRIMIRTKKDRRGYFNRLLADVYYEGVHINSRLVEAGCAKPYPKEQ